MATKTISHSVVIDAAYEADLDEDAVRNNYSGRGMYGDRCLGIVADTGQFALFCATLGATDEECDWLGRARSDGMGLSTIWYFPGVVTDDESSDEDDEYNN